MKTPKPSKAQSKAALLLLVHAKQLVTVRGDKAPRRGSQMRDIGVIKDGAVLISGGKIIATGTTDDLHKDPWIKKHRKNIYQRECTGEVIVPGFVDSHTHPVFAAPRLVDFEKRVAGATYEEIAAAGGGIRSSIAGVREASEAGLAEVTLAAFEEMMSFGTTTVEAKSGYGLSLDSELKSLKAIRTARKHWPGTVVATLLGAHVVPPEYKSKPDEYVRIICEEMIPQVAKAKLAEYVDVFCEKGAFTLVQSEKILAAAVRCGLRVRAHVGQLSQSKLQGILDLKPASLDHMDFVSDTDVRRLAASETLATLVPGANYFLATKAYPPARKLIDAGVAVALATDYNPGSSPTASMPMILSLACTQMKMSPAEALTAATINGAHALGLGDKKGSIEAGKDADLAFFEVDDYREIAYWFGGNRCTGVMLGVEGLDV